MSVTRRWRLHDKSHASLLLRGWIVAIGIACAEPPETIAAAGAAPMDSTARAELAEFNGELEQLRDSAPSAFDSIRNVAAFSVHMHLGRLGFAAGPFEMTVSPSLSEAIRVYERHKGLPETGEPLGYVLLEALRRDVRTLDDQVGLPSRSVVDVGGDYVAARGAWVFDGMGAQEIAAQISCHRASGECVEAQAVLSRFEDQPQLSTDLQRWEIASWDHAELATRPVDFPCTRYVLRINLLQRTATKIRSTIDTSETCDHTEKRDLVIQLADGPALFANNARARSKSLVETLRLGKIATAALAERPGAIP